MVNPEDQYMKSFVEFHWAKIKVKLSLHTSWKQKGSGQNSQEFMWRKATVFIYLFKKHYSMPTDQNKDQSWMLNELET
jgi:hypothetical protein